VKKKLCILLLCGTAWCQNLLNTPQPTTDNNQFHRTVDVLFGFGISATTGLATAKPWIGLVSGVAAGVADEAYHKSEPGGVFAGSHLAVISAGALLGYGVTKLEKHLEHKKQRQ
jgi:hypothetical protein